MKIQLENIRNFLISHDWENRSQSTLFSSYYPPIKLDLPSDYFLEVPNNENDRGFIKYSEGLIQVVTDVYENVYSIEDVKTFFTTENSIFSLQLIDPDTQLGSIKLGRLKNAFNQVFNSIKQTVIFSVSNQPIFGSAKKEVAQYLNLCRGKQTEFGSYIVKFELPENHLTLFGERSVPDLLFDSIEFLNQISSEHELNEINSDFIEQYKEYINIELFEAIIRLYKDAEIQNLNINLASYKTNKRQQQRDIKKNLTKIQLTVKGIKEVLLKDVPMEVKGSIFKLSSKSIDNIGKIWVEADIAEERQIIEVQLSSEKYKKALEAHKDGIDVYIKGIAKQKRNKYVIEDLQDFQIN